MSRETMRAETDEPDYRLPVGSGASITAYGASALHVNLSVLGYWVPTAAVPWRRRPKHLACL